MTVLEKLQLSILDGVEETRVHLDIEGDWDTILFACKDLSTVAVVPLQHLMTGEAAKDLVGEVVIPTVLKKYEATTMGIITTAWTVAIDTKNVPEGEESIDMMVKPSEHPRRTEALVILLADQETQRMMVAEIKRPEGAEHPELGMWDVKDVDGLEGRLWDTPLKALRGES